MNKGFWKSLQPHAIAIGIFLLISIIYCLPAIQGLVVNQSDVIGWKGMAQSSFEYKEKYGQFPLWTNSLFGGMPAYQVALDSKYNVTVAFLHYLFIGFLPTPAGLFFLNCIGFYILCVVLGLRNWVSIFGSIAYAFASYSPILAEVGHTTKLAAMGYAPAVIAGVVLLTQKRYVFGFAMTLLFSTLLLYQNHIQIAYYTVLLLLFVGVAFAVATIKKKDFKHLGLVAILAIIAGGISAAGYSVMLLPLNEYAKETMRGGRSELTDNTGKEDKTKGGLDKEYAFSWSYGIDESLTFVLPWARGGSSNPSELGETPKSVEKMQEIGLPNEAVNYFYQYMTPYWGNQPSTSGPVYFGVLVVLLSIAGLFLLNGWHKAWILAGALTGIILAWGGNLSAVNYFLFDYLPFYSKFRAPSMSLVMTQLCLALLASFSLDKILYGNVESSVLWKKLRPAAYIAAGVVLVMLFSYFTADFKNKKDQDIKDAITQSLTQGYAQGQSPSAQITQKAGADASSIMSGLKEDRKGLFTSDLIRSLIFIALGVILFYLAIKKKISATYLCLLFTLVSLIDLLGVDLRYLNKKKFISEDELLGSAFTPNNADLEIMKDTGYYRVFDQTESFTNDSRSAYFHNSVGGYHPAKLALYQDLIQHQIAKNNMQVLNMLNTKYVIISNPQTRQPMALPNPDALGPVWFARNIKTVKNANEEMKALDSISPKETVFVDERELSKLTIKPSFDSSATIYLLENRNDYITYESRSKTDQVAVFSEIYYPYGWHALIDGKEAPIARVDYLFRGLGIPAGNHKIEFKFEPESIKKGNIITLITGILSWLVLAFGILWEFKLSRGKVSDRKKN